MQAPLLYDDIEERKLGRQTKIDAQATQQLDDEVSRRENEVAEQELEVSDTNKRNLREDALRAIELIQQEPDPMLALSELPPAIQAEVKAILDEDASQQQTEQPVAQTGEEPTIGNNTSTNVIDSDPVLEEPNVNLPVVRASEVTEEPKKRNLLPIQ